MNRDQYKKTIEDYLIWDGSIKNWNNVNDDPNLRQKAGVEFYGDSKAYIATPNDQFKAGLQALRNRSVTRFSDQTRADLDTILNTVSSKIEPLSLINNILEMPAYDIKGPLKKNAEAHKKAKEVLEIYNSNNAELMLIYILNKVDDDLKPAVLYHATNNPNFKGIFQRAIVQAAIREFHETFQQPVEGKKEPVFDKEKIQSYLKLIADKTEDNNELAEYFIPLTANVYLKEK